MWLCVLVTRKPTTSTTHPRSDRRVLRKSHHFSIFWEFAYYLCRDSCACDWVGRSANSWLAQLHPPDFLESSVHFDPVVVNITTSVKASQWEGEKACSGRKSIQASGSIPSTSAVLVWLEWLDDLIIGAKWNYQSWLHHHTGLAQRTAPPWFAVKC